MSKSGTFIGAIEEVGEGETMTGQPFIGSVIFVPGIKETVERRCYYSNEKEQFVSRIVLVRLGGDPEKPPFPQLKALEGRAVLVLVGPLAVVLRRFARLALPEGGFLLSFFPWFLLGIIA